jgi:hypothetical protein
MNLNFLKTILNAEDAKDSQRTQRSPFNWLFLCVLCGTFATSAFKDFLHSGSPT